MGDADAGTAWRSLTPPGCRPPAAAQPAAHGSVPGVPGAGCHPGARRLLALGTHLVPPHMALVCGGHSRAQPPGTTRGSSLQGTALPLPALLSMSAAGSLPAPEHPKRCEGPAQTPSCLPSGSWSLARMGMGSRDGGVPGWGCRDGGRRRGGSRDGDTGMGGAGMKVQGWGMQGWGCRDGGTRMRARGGVPMEVGSTEVSVQGGGHQPPQTGCCRRELLGGISL